MKRYILIFLLISLVSGGFLILISITIPLIRAEIPIKVDNGLMGLMTISHPEYLRLGDPAEVKLKVTFAEEDGIKADPSLKIKVELQTYRLEVNPAEEVTAIIPADGTAFFSWQITPHSEDKMKVTLWCFRISTSGPELMLSRDITFDVKTIVGMQYRFARWLLVEVIVLCLVLAGVAWYRNRRN